MLQTQTPKHNSNILDEVNLSKQTNKDELDKKLPTQADSNVPESAEIRQYIAILKKQINENWNPTFMNQAQRIVVIFKINKDGDLADLKIVQSSGNGDCDRSALDAVKKTAPFNPLPKNYKGDSVCIQFYFNIFWH